MLIFQVYSYKQSCVDLFIKRVNCEGIQNVLSLINDKI